ncbi:GNAT family N-acetyltransferase [Polaribacter sp. HL-MS24]|uniref:GNAT family N-acetyltransferase n=1 Tax=Polaribacter sp. HL-MS24 TaxID=3077735 RepID=UPI0029347C21|nr:GNAT family N-acetyltransferase [Polaribacter sp. HL-MS24]WOC39691.1 GNAT family N-acetyltransferase [Polaribacter sp. HL-MS24]
MFQILKANSTHSALLSKLSEQSFLVPHGHSAPKKDIDNYIAANFSQENFLEELENPKNEYHLIYYQNEIAGFSKVVLNSENENIKARNTMLLSRLYLLKEFYGLGLGKALLEFNISFAKRYNQRGIWLAVWVENPRAILFYKKMGFQKVGAYDFKISETHSNPNHILYLAF